MLTCIACSKQLNGNGSLPQQDEDEAVGTPSTKQAVKTLTAQVPLEILGSCLDFEKMYQNYGNRSSELFFSCLEANKAK
jgi:hypothetical protein